VTGPVGDSYGTAIGCSVLGGYGLEEQAVGRSATYETVSIVASSGGASAPSPTSTASSRCRASWTHKNKRRATFTPRMMFKSEDWLPSLTTGTAVETHDISVDGRSADFNSNINHTLVISKHTIKRKVLPRPKYVIENRSSRKKSIVGAAVSHSQEHSQVSG
jgi:hypothetical protein